MKKGIKGNSLLRVLLKLNILPVILLTLMITFFSAGRFAASMNEEIRNGLVDLCNTVTVMYDALYKGNYHVVERDDAAYLMKGSHQLNDDFAIIDSVKEKTGVDITFFCYDTRVLTTIKNKDGERAVGTKANDNIIESILNGDQAGFFSGTLIEGVKYFSYYAPIHASDGSCIGMIFTGKPSDSVERLVVQSVGPLIAIELIVMLAACFITMHFSNDLVGAIKKIELFLGKVSGGDFHAEFDPAVFQRTDELGEMGRYLVQMQMSLRELVEQDMLTGLNNRRSGEKLLKQARDNYVTDGVPFCIAIGDIDYFKRVNDTYGHECGDVVLSKLASWLRNHMEGKGFAVRWGGEEFLLVYEDMHLDTVASCVEELIREIRGRRIEYGDMALGVTMTFGLMEGSGDKIEHIVRDADAKLYQGKNSGRDKLVY